MILFPPCKINLGLDVLERRPDGYHTIETVMAPVAGLCDSLEIVRDEAVEGVVFSASGLALDCPPEKNLCLRAYHLLSERRPIGGVRMHLHKAIPYGAGLGGGSSDAAYALRGLIALFGLEAEATILDEIAARLGSDVPFFLSDGAQRCSGRGERREPCSVDLRGWHLTIVKPPYGISTAEAYAGIVPQRPVRPLAERIALGPRCWREMVINAFEPRVFALHPDLERMKERLYEAGAVYASMSGSGSALYALFRHETALTVPEGWFVHSETIGESLLE